MLALVAWFILRNLLTTICYTSDFSSAEMWVSWLPVYVYGDLLWHRPPFHSSAPPKPPKPTKKNNLNQARWFNSFLPSWLCSHMTQKPLTAAHDPGITSKASVRSITSLELFYYGGEGLKLCRCNPNKKMLLFAGVVSCYQLIWDCWIVELP